MIHAPDITLREYLWKFLHLIAITMSILSDNVPWTSMKYWVRYSACMEVQFVRYYSHYKWLWSSFTLNKMLWTWGVQLYFFSPYIWYNCFMKIGNSLNISFLKLFGNYFVPSYLMLMFNDWNQQHRYTLLNFFT